jgi:hypothetical protein
MLKKYTAYVLICISGILYAGHSFVPHQHHHGHSQNGLSVVMDDHHDHDDADHHDEDQKSTDDHSNLSDILAHFAHGESFYKNDEGHEIKVDFSNADAILIPVPYSIKWVENIPIPIKRICYHYKEPEYHSLSRVTFGLRAPPVVA